MIRTQLYLPEDLYKTLKAKAKAKNMTFASFVRLYLEDAAMPKENEEEELHRRLPFLKMAGFIKGGKKDDSDNEKLDEFLYSFEWKK